MADIRVSQVVVEQAQTVAADVRVSQVVVETALAPTIGTRVSQIVVEILTVLNPGPTPVPPSGFTTRIVPIRWLRRGPIFSKENKRVTYNLFQLDCLVGEGNANPPGDDPHVFMRYSDDGGRTWSSVLARSLGRRGHYGHQVQWWRGGMGRNRVYEVYGSDPVPVALYDGFADVDPGAD